jgi:trehalose 6-phosphate phosphatase
VKDIFGEDGRAELARFARSNLFVAFDFDGTLAPIVAHPDDAAMRPRTKALLEQLCRTYPCAVISGRARADALERMGNLQLWAASGNHGAEVLGAEEPYEQLIGQWAPTIRDALAGEAGVLIEDKRFSISIHYRNAADPRRAVAAIDRVVARLSGARVLAGKMVVNVIPAEAPHKGIALDCMRRWAGCDTAVFVGDDVTDEDAFALPPEEVLSIRVGRAAGTRARFYLDAQEDVDRLIQGLIEARNQAVRLHAQL